MGNVPATVPPDDFPEFAKERLRAVLPGGEEGSIQLERDPRLVVYLVPIDLIDAHDSNPNEQDEETFNTLAEEVDDEREGSPGYIEPAHLVPLDNGRFRLVAGEHRWRAMRAIGKTHLPSLLMTGGKWKSEEFQEFMLVRMNVLRGGLNPDKFLRLYERYVSKYGSDQLKRLFAVVDTNYWAQLTGTARAQLKDAGVTKEFLADLDTKTAEIRSVDDLAAVLNGLFAKHGSDLRWSFMVFSFGNKEHLYVRMDAESARAMEAVKKWCRDNRADINLVMAPVMRRFGEVVEDPKLLASLAGSADQAKE